MGLFGLFHRLKAWILVSGLGPLEKFKDSWKKVKCGLLSHNRTLSILLYVAKVAVEAILAHKSI